MKAFLIFPNQLYEKTSIHKQFDHVFLVEDPIYFNEIVKPNKIKIAYMRAASKWFFDNKIAINKTYIDCANVKTYKFLSDFLEVGLYDPTDIAVMAKLKKHIGENRLHVFPSPNFRWPTQNI